MATETEIELDAQYRQLREECGLLGRPERAHLLVGGADAAEYLQGQLTNDTEALEPGPDDRVLEVGTGSGYQAAVLAEIVSRVVTLEIEPMLARRAGRTLRELGYTNVKVLAADGRRGLPRAAPFDAILLAAAPARLPDALADQLVQGGRIVGPVGEGMEQVLRRWRRRGASLEAEDLIPVRFVPMTSEGR